MAKLLLALCLAWAAHSRASGMRMVKRRQQDDEGRGVSASSRIVGKEEDRGLPVLEGPPLFEEHWPVLEEVEASQMRAGDRRRRRRRDQPSSPGPNPGPSPGPSPSPFTCPYRTGDGAVSWAAFGGVNTGSGPRKVNSRAAVGDYEFVAIGGSKGGSKQNNNTPWNKKIMTNEAFKLIVVKGPDDKKAELWYRKSKGGGNIFIPGKAKDNPYTIFAVKGNLNMNKMKTAAIRGHNSTKAELKNPGGSGVTIGVFFFDDPMKLNEAPNGGDILCRNWGYGDGDGFAVVLYQPGKKPPGKFSITQMEPGGGSQFIALTAVIPVR